MKVHSVIRNRALMKTLTFSIVAMVGGLHATVFAEDSVYVALRISDQQDHSNTLTFGVHTQATDGFDRSLGEIPIPPIPAVALFDVRFIDPTRRKGRDAGEAGYKDIRPFRGPAQADTFYVRFQPMNSSYPMVFSWPESLDGKFEQGIIRYKRNDSTMVIDMMKQHVAELGEDSNSLLMLVTSGPRFHVQGEDTKTISNH